MVAATGHASLDVHSLSKTFGTTTVLQNASLRIAPGEVHALIGANGAGKSTLVKCITGVFQPDAGSSIQIADRSAPTSYTPGVAADLGIRVVHQEAPVVSILTIAEVAGLYRGFPKAGRTFIRWRKLRKDTRTMLERLGISLSPDLHAGRLTAGQRAMVMLAFALADVEKGAKLLVLDEPTASLPAHDAERFLAAVVRAAAYGVGILLVTHRLSEIFAVAKRVTVLRDGKVVWVGEAADTSHDQLVAELVGPEAAERRAAGKTNIRRSGRFHPEPRNVSVNDDAPLLRVEALSGSTVSNVSFSLGAGELLGVTGITGSGASELGRLIAGIVRRREGAVLIDGEDLPATIGPRQAIERGIAYVPADRLTEGGIPFLSVRENIALPSFGDYWLKWRDERRDVREVLTVLDVRPPDPTKRFHELSGGNQQKVIIGKWALMRPRLFILDDPTTGVDPGAREELYAVLRGLLEAGTAILFISSEPEQLERLASRVLVLRRGVISAELDGARVTETAITRASL